MRNRLILYVATLGSVSYLAGCDRAANTPSDQMVQNLDEAEYVGGQQCAGCHANETAAWIGSHHDLAMQAANDDSILGNFDNVTFLYNGITTEFFRRGSEHWVRTDGPNGELTEYQIRYAFGVEPLQQYLVELEDGAFHSLSIAWDSQPEAEGGQRWFHLYPDDTVDAMDPLHWTGIFQNWNSTCAECHSTNLMKNFSLTTNSYSTTFSSINVDCEACHGPGSLHVVEPIQAPMTLTRDADASWIFEPETVIAKRMPALDNHQEIETCAQCHSRRSQFSDSFEPGDALLDSFRPSLLEQNLYHTDGQIQDEVYVYGSFLQSRMHAAGVTCSDCHDPHSTSLRFEGNALCGQCHVASTYDVVQHHHHERETSGSFCVDCHMPSQTYMVVDPRRDHSFRIPRPDLSIELGTPNACGSCHNSESAEWAQTTIANWYPEGRWQTAHYGQTLNAGRTWAADRGQQLAELVTDPAMPSIVRATAVRLLAQQLDDDTLNTIDDALRVEEPLIQLAALDALEGLPPEARVQLAQRFLTHELRALRITAARILLPARAELSQRRSADLDIALTEYREAQLFNGDRAEGLVNWASTLVQLGQTEEAESYFQNAIDRAPIFTAAYTNLADLYRLRGDEAAARTLLQQAVANNPEDPGAHFALGLSHVRAGSPEDAFAEIETAAMLAPDIPYFQYVVGIALNSNGDQEGATEKLKQVHERFPGHRDTLLALATIHRDGGDLTEAEVYARLLLALSPSDSVAQRLLNEVTTTPP